MAIAEFYVWPGSKCDSIVINLSDHKNFHHHYWTCCLPLDDAKYKGITRSLQNVMVVAGDCLEPVIGIVDTKPGIEQFVYLFSVLEWLNIECKM